MFLSLSALLVTLVFHVSGVASWTSSYYPWHETTTDWRTTTSWTQPPTGLFHNDLDRDNFIMKISNELSSIKSMLMGVLGGIGISTTPSTGSSSTFVAFTARLSAMVHGMGLNQIILFDDVILNRGDGYDQRLGVFRCPLAGTYQFSVSIGAYGSNELEIVKNGQDIAKVFTTRFGRNADGSNKETKEEESKDESQFEEKKDEEEEEEQKDDEKRYLYGYTEDYYGYYHSNQANLAQPGSAQVIVDLKVGDEVWVRHSSDSIRDVLFGNGMSSFSGTLLHKAK